MSTLTAALDGAQVMNASEIAYVCLLGIGIVFIGLVSIIIICSIMAAIFKAIGKNQKTVTAPAAAAAEASAVIPNKQEFVAAVSAAIAESCDKDVSAIRIVSIKKL